MSLRLSQQTSLSARALRCLLVSFRVRRAYLRCQGAESGSLTTSSLRSSCPSVAKATKVVALRAKFLPNAYGVAGTSLREPLLKTAVCGRELAQRNASSLEVRQA